MNKRYDIRADDIRRMCAAGMSGKEMARVYGCSPEYIRLIKHRMGLTKKQQPRPDIDAAIAIWKAGRSAGQNPNTGGNIGEA